MVFCFIMTGVKSHPFLILLSYVFLIYLKSIVLPSNFLSFKGLVSQQ